MYFQRKAYQDLLRWKELYSGSRAALLEGARRTGKSTLAERFARTEYRSCILLDFSRLSAALTACFDDLGDLDLFFLRLQALTGTRLYPGQSVVVFDEVQLFPRARQAIKHLVADGRFHYIETGSLISIRRHVQDILIPSEELKIPVQPMDYEEFCAAAGRDYAVLRQLYERRAPVGRQINRELMRQLRIYMAVGGMPQAVEAYVSGSSLADIDQLKRQIIALYEDDFRKLDESGRLSSMYRAIPAQLSRGLRRFRISTALGKRASGRDVRLMSELLDSRTVLPCYNTTDPRVSLTQTRDQDRFKLYVADTGLFITLLFMDRPAAGEELYSLLLSDRLPANLGYLYENLVAQMISASGRELYYHTWDMGDGRHYYEVDFLLADAARITALEVKSSGTGRHASLTAFASRFARHLGRSIILSHKDVSLQDGLEFLPLYMAPFVAGQPGPAAGMQAAAGRSGRERSP